MSEKEISLGVPTERQVAAFDRMIERHKNRVKPAKGRLFPSTLRLPADLDEAIDNLARDYGSNRAAVIKSLLRRALDLPAPLPRDPLA